MKSGMNILIFQCLSIQFLLSEVIIMCISELLELPQECRVICIDHSMSDFFQSFVGFYSWILEKISIYSCDFMCLAELYGYTMVVSVYSSIYSLSSIDHCKVRWWISSMRQIVKQYFVIFFCFLKNMFRSEYISSNAIYCYKESPLTL